VKCTHEMDVLFSRYGMASGDHRRLMLRLCTIVLDMDENADTRAICDIQQGYRIWSEHELFTHHRVSPNAVVVGRVKLEFIGIGGPRNTTCNFLSARPRRPRLPCSRYLFSV